MPTKKTVAKKVVKPKKKVVKKTAKKAVKKSSKKASSKKQLTYSSHDTSFWVSDGQILNSLVALSNALDTMEKDVYTFHAEGNENDFANWVEVVLCDGDCAKDLRKAKTQRSAKTAIVKHLKYYTI